MKSDAEFMAYLCINVNLFNRKYEGCAVIGEGGSFSVNRLVLTRKRISLTFYSLHQFCKARERKQTELPFCFIFRRRDRRRETFLRSFLAARNAPYFSGNSPKRRVRSQFLPFFDFFDVFFGKLLGLALTSHFSVDKNTA